MRFLSSPSGRLARFDQDVARRISIRAVGACLLTAFARVEECRAAASSVVGTVNGGVVVVSSTSGAVVYCPATTRTYGAGAGAQIQPNGICVTLAGAKAVPVVDAWQLLPAGGGNFFLVDKTTGKVLQCVVSTPTNGAAGGPSAGTCVDSGTFP